MKGMLIKDFCILKLQKNAVLVLLAMCVVFTVFMKSPTYIVNLFPMYGKKRALPHAFPYLVHFILRQQFGHGGQIVGI